MSTLLPTQYEDLLQLLQTEVDPATIEFWPYARDFSHSDRSIYGQIEIFEFHGPSWIVCTNRWSLMRFESSGLGKSVSSHNSAIILKNSTGLKGWGFKSIYLAGTVIET